MIMPSDMPGLPIALYSGSRSVPANGRSRFADEQGIRNPIPGGIWVDAVHIAELNAPYADDVSIGAYIDVQFSLGPYKFSNDFIPVYVLAPRDDSRTQRFMQYATWHLPKPLYIPQGGVISPEFMNRDSSTHTVRVVFKGRHHGPSPAPSMIDVPWIGLWKGARRSGSTDTSDQSNQSHLLNPFNMPLEIERFTAALIGSSSTTNTLDSGSLATATSLFTSIFIRMIGSDGKIIIRDRTPWGSVFNLEDNTWWAKSSLGPKEWIIAYVDELLSGVTYPDANNFDPYIAMVGSRKESVHALR